PWDRRGLSSSIRQRCAHAPLAQPTGSRDDDVRQAGGGHTSSKVGGEPKGDEEENREARHQTRESESLSPTTARPFGPESSVALCTVVGEGREVPSGPMGRSDPESVDSLSV